VNGILLTCVMASQYSRRMAVLSSRIFGEIGPNKSKQAKAVMDYFSNQPYYKNKQFKDWYPPIHDTNQLIVGLRSYGLYVDEHLDFTEYMEKQREMRGKGKKNRKK